MLALRFFCVLSRADFRCIAHARRAIPLVSFINHSDDPNCVYDEATDSIRAKRRLREGEEATVDYLRYQEKGSFTYKACQSGFRRKAFWA